MPPVGFTNEQLEAFKLEMRDDFNVIVHEAEKNDILTDGLIELVPEGTNKATGIKDAITFLNVGKKTP